MMVLYFVIGSLVNWLVKNPGAQGRRIAIDVAIWPKVAHLWLTVFWHSQLWFWRDTALNPWSFLGILGLFCLSLWLTMRSQGRWLRCSLEALLYVIIAFTVAYAPVLAPKDFQVSFRYAMATMPLLLYVALWSTWQIASHFHKAWLARVASCAIAATAVIVCNQFTELFIVGPQDKALAHVRIRLQTEALPYIQSGQRLTVAMRCNFDPPRLYGYVAPGLEYGMRIWQYQEQCVSAVVHGLRMLGIETTLAPPDSMVHKYTERVHVVSTKWGTIIATHNSMTNEEIAVTTGSAAHSLTFAPGEEGEYASFDIYRAFFRRM